MLLSPADGSTVNVFPRAFTVSWQAVPGATSYRVTVDFCAPGLDASNKDYLGPCDFPAEVYGYTKSGGWVQEYGDGSTTGITSYRFESFPRFNLRVGE